MIVSIRNFLKLLLSFIHTEDKVAATDKTEGDMGFLDFRPRISLALILDPENKGADWRALAQRLNFSHLEGGLQTMTSPTKELLNLYEVTHSRPLY